MAPIDHAYVAALRAEREGYVRFGKDDRVADVDAELARLGVAVEEPTPEQIGAALMALFATGHAPPPTPPKPAPKPKAPRAKKGA